MHIVGASGHAKVIADILSRNGDRIDGIWDDNKQLTSVFGIQISGDIIAFQSLVKPNVIVAIGDNLVRKRIAQSIKGVFGIVIHPNSAISETVVLEEGSVVMANVAVNANARIGKHVILNTNSSIDHDCVIGDFVHVSPQVGLAGNVSVAEGTHIGIGANVIQGIKIGRWATIGAGAVILRDVPDFAVVVGNPGKIIKYNTQI